MDKYLRGFIDGSQVSEEEARYCVGEIAHDPDDYDAGLQSGAGYRAWCHPTVAEQELNRPFIEETLAALAEASTDEKIDDVERDIDLYTVNINERTALLARSLVVFHRWGIAVPAY